MRTATIEIVVWFAVLTGLYLVSISTLSPVELAVGLTASLGGALAARRTRLLADVRWRGGRGLARALAALPLSVARGLAVLMAALARGTGGAHVERVRLRPGTDPGWAATVLSAAPDTCVLDATDEGELLVHGLDGRSVTPPGGAG